MAKITIYDVAGRARVSLATVSRVLNSPEKVKKATRERVLKVIKEIGYHPNVIARGLASGKTTIVGVIISDITRASVAQMLDGILDIAAKYNYSIKLFSISPEKDFIEAVKEIGAQQVDGVLMLNDELNEDTLRNVVDFFEGNAIPLVLANAFSLKQEIPCVAIDYKNAAYEATKMLLDDGRKNIHFISTIRKYSVNEAKEEGYTKAIVEAGLEPKIFRTSGEVSLNAKHFQQFLESNLIDAVLGSRDSISVSFLNEARNKGLNVPDDIAVISFQNTKYSMLSLPTLTSIDIPVYDVGAVAMRYLTKLMNNEKVEEHNVILPHKIIKRNSSR